MEEIISAIDQYHIEDFRDFDSMSRVDEYENYHDNYYPDLGKLTVDDILLQDDPPKELYLGYEFFDFTEEEYILSFLFEEEYWEEFWKQSKNFNIYKHFSIESDISDNEAEGLLEAAMGSS